MKKLYRPLALGLSLTMMLGFGGQVSAQKSVEFNMKMTEPAPKKDPSAEEDQCKLGKKPPAAESFKLFYIRSATGFTGILNEITKVNPCLKGTVIGSEGKNVIVVYGKEKQRKEIERITAILDFPRQGVKMDMWGILISSNNPDQLAKVMVRINQEIDRTQKLLQETYKQFEDDVRDRESLKIDERFRKLFEETLGYRGALDQSRISLSMIDMLLLINAASDQPDGGYNKIANNICNIFENNKKYDDYRKVLASEGKIPFQNYLEVGLHQEFPINPKNSQKNQPLPAKTCKGGLKPSKNAEQDNYYARKAILDFALEYSYLANEPENFNPKSLQQSAETLNSVFQPIITAINRDVEELFMKPTVAKIQRIVSEFGDVQYAEVGKTSVAGLNGVESTVASTTISAFDETTPLRLNELLEEAGRLNASSKDLLPLEGAAYAPLLSGIAALSKNNSLWRGLTSGITMTITPSVLRNSASAELDIDLTTAPKGTEVQNENGDLRPLSRISQNQVTTSVYVNTLDIFALSTFNSQTTIDGGRWPIPVIGHVWKGVFGGLPYFGDLFSLKNPPKNVQHQSIVLTNSFIVPTAMGLAPLYQSKTSEVSFHQRCLAVQNYLQSQKPSIDIVAGQAEKNCKDFPPENNKENSPPVLSVPQLPR